jgi:putative ABC transport system permease protein
MLGSVRTIVGFWLLALRNLGTRPTRTILALIGLSVPVVGVLGLFSLSEGIRTLLGDTLAQVQGILVLRENAPTDLFSELPSAMADRLRRVPGVRVVAREVWKLAPPIEGRSLFARASADFPGKSRGPRLEGLLNLAQIEGQDLTEHAKLRREVYHTKMIPSGLGGGRFLEPTDRSRPNVVISARIARDYPDSRGHARRVGQTLQVGSQVCSIVGIYDTGTLLLDNTVVMELGAARRLLGLGDDTVSCFLVEPDDPAATEEVARRIERAIPGVSARTMVEFQVGLGRFLGRLDRLLLLVVGLALFVGSVSVVNTMLMSVSERFTEFGVLRSNGWSRGEVLRLVLAESTCLGTLAGSLGGLMATIAIAVVDPFLEGGLRLSIQPGFLLLVFALAVLLGLFGGLYPAWRVSRLAPMETIRRGSSG